MLAPISHNIILLLKELIHSIVSGSFCKNESVNHFIKGVGVKNIIFLFSIE
jgi:hypothetical protein